MRVQELANRVRIAPHVVRYYARIGLLRPKRDAGNGYRRFGAEDLKRIVFIRQAQRLGFTLTEIRLVLEMSSRGKTPCHTVRAIVQQRIAENAEQLAALQALHERMTDAARRWRRMRDGVPDGDAICRLIEAVSQEAS